jgi:sugar phosphate isomerase/epimerase
VSIKRGVSLYSFQQAQYLKQMSLEDQVRFVGTELNGATGIEMVDEMSLRYPEPGKEFDAKWFGWMEKYGTRPVALDINMDVLQFRDHVMTHEEVAERMRHDMRLAKRLGFTKVRTLSVVPIEIIELVLPYAEELDLKLGKEVHQPMKLDGKEVNEIIELAERTGTKHLGIVPDLGIFQFQSSEVQLALWERRGAQPTASAANLELAGLMREGRAPIDVKTAANQTAGNLRVEFQRFVTTGDTDPTLHAMFSDLKHWADQRIVNAKVIDYVVAAEPLTLSHTSLDLLRELTPFVIHIHGKFNYMSEKDDKPGEFFERSIDYPGVIAALKAGNYSGYINSEYEGQRYFQDMEVEYWQSETEQVRRHHEMLARLIGG